MYNQIPLASTLQKIPSLFCFDLSCNYSCLPSFHISPSYHLYHDSPFMDFPAHMVLVPLFVCIVIQIMYLHLKLQLRIRKERGHMTLCLCKLSLYNIFFSFIHLFAVLFHISLQLKSILLCTWNTFLLSIPQGV